MAINYSVRAEVFDITSPSSKITDRYFVDSNVLIWWSYSKASVNAKPYQVTSYPDFLKIALQFKIPLFSSIFTLLELFHVIEKTEYHIHCHSSGAISLKEFRHNLVAKRRQQQIEVDYVLTVLKQFITLLDNSFTEDLITSVQKTYLQDLVDSYDHVVLDVMRKNGITTVLSDDGDFSTVAGIRLYTANPDVINAARIQGKLLTT